MTNWMKMKLQQYFHERKIHHITKWKQKLFLIHHKLLASVDVQWQDVQ